MKSKYKLNCPPPKKKIMRILLELHVQDNIYSPLGCIIKGKICLQMFYESGNLGNMYFQHDMTNDNK